MKYNIGDNVQVNYNDFHEEGRIIDTLDYSGMEVYLVKFNRNFRMRDYNMVSDMLVFPADFITACNTIGGKKVTVVHNGAEKSLNIEGNKITKEDVKTAARLLNMKVE